MTNTPEVYKGLVQVGGHPALDFLNTVKYRGRREPGDRLTNLRDVIDWAELAQIITAAEARELCSMAARYPDKSDKVFGQILKFRETMRQFLDDSDTRSAVAAKYLETALSGLRLTALANVTDRIFIRYVPADSLENFRQCILHVAVSFLEMSPRPKLKTCAADDCDWLFIDRSKAGRRRWCDTRTCGNRDRVRRFRGQSATARTPPE